MAYTALTDLLCEIHALKVKLADVQNDTHALRRDYEATCDSARLAIDSIEDGEIATGLRLHGVNGISWRETSALIGCADIRKRCHDYLRERR